MCGGLLLVEAPVCFFPLVMKISRLRNEVYSICMCVSLSYVPIYVYQGEMDSECDIKEYLCIYVCVYIYRFLDDGLVPSKGQGFRV